MSNERGNDVEEESHEGHLVKVAIKRHQQEAALTVLKANYRKALTSARAVAREHGYALAVHGSEIRDLDLIAAPWIEEASSAEVLIEAIREAVGGVIPDLIADPAFDYRIKNPQSKPHGRRSWAIHLPAIRGLAQSVYLDIAVTPRTADRGP